MAMEAAVVIMAMPEWWQETRSRRRSIKGKRYCVYVVERITYILTDSYEFGARTFAKLLQALSLVHRAKLDAKALYYKRGKKN